MKHLGPLALFAALAVAWTWPLVLHLGDAVPGHPGDNYSYLWNLWWMRHVLATPGLAYFHTSYLFYPFGTTIADHPHTALPALVAATLLRRASIVTAQNLLLIAYVFTNMAAMYALVWDITRHRRGPILGGVIFGLSPYLASHLLGHFDLIAAFVLPLFALCARRAIATRSSGWAIAAGIVLVATAYTAYYYVVYLLFFLAVYAWMSLEWTPIRWSRRQLSQADRAIPAQFIALGFLLAALALWIIVTGGGTVTLGRHTVTAHTPQNALTGVWVCVIVAALCVWRPARMRDRLPADRLRCVVTSVAWIGAVFVIGAAPLLWQAALLMTRGEYVTPAYQWRSAPRGVDLLALLIGPPFHPLTPGVERAYAALELDRVEAVGWLGIVPLALLVASLAARTRVSGELRRWRAVAVVFAIWALGPTLTVAGFDTGLKLPATLLRYLPFVANARMPGRAIVVCFMALAVLIGMHIGSATGRLRSPALQWLLIALLVFEYWAPIRLTPLDRPAVYEALARAAPGAVCEVPFGVGDGLSRGVGSQDRRVLYYATLHEHPLAGGYIGRMPVDAAARYAQTAVAAPLLRLSAGEGTAYLPDGEAPCRYLVVNRAASSAALRAYVATLQADRMASDDARDLYRLR